MSYPYNGPCNYSNYGYGGGGGGGFMPGAAGGGAPPGGASGNGRGHDDSGGGGPGGYYNPRYHFQAAQNAGFELGSEDGMPKTLYVGNLDSSVTEEFIATLFGQIGTVVKTKVISETTADPYAFVELSDHYTASQALVAMNRRMLLDKEMKVNWATQPGTQQRVDTSKHFHVFVGDLSPEVDNKTLKEAFSPFGEVSDAKVIRDPTTLKSKGYGFVSFPKREDAERAIEQMNGQWLGRRTIRTNWATRKPGQGGGMEFGGGGGAFGGGGGGAGGHGSGPGGKPTMEEISAQTGENNTSVYVGNLGQLISDTDIRTAFARFGPIQNIRHFRPQGYAFVCYADKESACRTIAEMNGEHFMGQTLRCSWGKVDGGASSSSRQYQPNYTQNYGVGGMGGYGYGPGGAGAMNPMAGAFSSPAAANSMQQYWQQYYQYQQFYGGGSGGAGGGYAQ